MDRVVIEKNCPSSLTFNQDSYILINDNVHSKNIEVNIINCKVTIIDKGVNIDKIFNFKNCTATLIQIINDDKMRELTINNDNSNVEYNIIDLCDKDINYTIKEKSDSENCNCNINIASVCYKNKNKKYVINTSNMKRNTINEINCFGIVKDKSVLDYEVSSFIEKGAVHSIVRQNSNILLFDDNSLGKNSPVLLIEENDVKANHGSSIGKIDDDTMFYLCSRGISKKEATNLICLGKLEYLIKKIDDEEIREGLISDFKERMD